ncbi:MAG: hypothetical protein Q9169_007914 [Polycauliona sp. 2 TL-2023]
MAASLCCSPTTRPGQQQIRESSNLFSNSSPSPRMEAGKQEIENSGWKSRFWQDFFLANENSDYNDKDAAGLVNSYYFGRDVYKLDRDSYRIKELHRIVEGIELALQQTNCPRVWSIVINLWLDDCKKHEHGELDRFLDPCLVTAVKRIVFEENRRERLQIPGLNGRPTTYGRAFGDSLSRYEEEMHRREGR